MLHFIDCNSRVRFEDIFNFEITEETLEKQLSESIESGLMPDRENGIFLKDGYGALVGFCPNNCSTIDEAIKYTLLDKKRKTVGKPTAMERIREVITGENLPFDVPYDPYYGYHKLIEEGYDLVVGPGCVVNGQQWEKAIYCRNYE